MANVEHLAILRKGKEAWNRWREEHPEVIPNLTKADLRGMYFGMFNLNYADLQGAEIVGDSDLDEPDENGCGKSQGYNPSSANFTQASLRGANLSRLAFSNLDDSEPERDLKSVDLRGADLTEANLSRAYIVGARLGELIVESSNWHLAEVLIEPYRYERRVIPTKMRGANLTGACLDNINLNNLDLSGANLSEASLIETQALGTDFREATLTGACIQEWNINSETKLDGVTCDYVYLKLDWSEERKHYPSERRPSSGKFSLGDFQALFQQAIETVDLIFSNGIDWTAFFRSFQELQSQYNDKNLFIQAIEKKSGGVFIIRLEVPPESDKEAIESRAKELYERDRQLLEAQYQASLQAKDRQITVYKEWLDSERQRNTDLTGIVKTMADKETSKVTQHFNAPVTGVAGNVEGNQNIYSLKQHQTLAEAAKEIQQLLNQLSETYPAATSTEQMTIATKAVEAIEKNPALKQRVIGALKAGGTEALKELVDHPAVNILLAVLEGWQKPG